MKEPQEGSAVVIETDAVVIGSGLAGIAAAIHLARDGFKVMCLEQRRDIANTVGESLDWSAPDLFAKLGLPMEELIATNAATWKRHITVKGHGCGSQEYLPGAWLAESPWNVEVRTLHLDRARTDARLRAKARELGVVTLQERVADFAVLDESSARHRRILGLRTVQGTFVRASWFVDASGSDASLLGRRFALKAITYGLRKAAIWTHVQTDRWREGTTLYMLGRPDTYMEWLWEIPVRPGISSIGYIAPGSSVKAQRNSGLSPRDILDRHCRTFPHLHAIVERRGIEEISTTSFLCRTYRNVCGTNWIIVGEAASQSDPITGNGVTAALRHAAEGSALIRRYRRQGIIPSYARAAYDLRVISVGRYFNSLIEKLFYQPSLRDRVGLFGTARIYTVPAWLMNLIYTRIRPQTLPRTIVISAVMALLRGITATAYKASEALDSKTRGTTGFQLSTARESHAL